MNDGFELPNAGDTRRRGTLPVGFKIPGEVNGTLPSGFKHTIPLTGRVTYGTLPAGMKPAPRPESRTDDHIKEKNQSLPKGYDNHEAETGYYPVTDNCDNCGKRVTVGIKIGITKNEGLKKSNCPSCGCKIIKTNWYGRPTQYSRR